VTVTGQMLSRKPAWLWPVTVTWRGSLLLWKRL